MSNYAFGTMWLELPNENVDKFIGLFLSHNKSTNIAKERHFYRTTLEKFDMQKVMNGNSELVIDFTSGWSLGDCFMDVYPNKGAGKCPNLEDICKELGVTILAAVGEEPMEGFREKIRYIKGQPFFYQKLDTPYHLNSEDWEDWKSNMEMEAQ